jgi:transposase
VAEHPLRLGRASGRSQLHTSTASRIRPSGHDGSGTTPTAQRSRPISTAPAFSASYTAPCEVPRGFRTVHPLGWMSGKVKELPRPKKSFSPEFKDEAVKMVIETSRPIARVAKELGINEGTLGNWVGIYRREHAGEEPALTVNERARLRELERETRELKMENDFLKKAAAYFAKDHR